MHAHRHSDRRTARVALAALLALATLIPAGTALAATPKTPLDVNLVTNPDADSGASGDGTTVVPVPGWTTTGSFTVAPYGAPGLPDSVDDAMFACGPNTAAASATQVITIKGRATLTDAGNLTVNVFARVAATGADTASVTFAFRNGTGKVLKKDVVGPFTDTNLGFGGGGSGHAVPKKTRSVKVTMRGVRNEGTYCDAFFDDLEVTLGKK